MYLDIDFQPRPEIIDLICTFIDCVMFKTWYQCYRGIDFITLIHCFNDKGHKYGVVIITIRLDIIHVCTLKQFIYFIIIMFFVQQLIKRIYNDYI